MSEGTLGAGSDLIVIEHFALLHDCKREDDGADPEHGERAAEFVHEIAATLTLSPAQLDTLALACAGHERGGVSDDPTIGCCWDADRLELSRLRRRPITELLSTAAAKTPAIQAAAWRRGVTNTTEVFIMSKPRHMRGAPAQYSTNGQSRAARKQIFEKYGFKEKHMMHIMHNEPEKLREKMPRITWAEVMQPILDDENLVYSQELLHADIEPAEFDDFTYIPERLIFQAALALYDCRAPTGSVRHAVEHAWIAHSTIFKALAGDDLLPVLRYCQFKPPARLGFEFSVWRGTRGVSLEIAQRGRSWTTDPRVACVWIDQINRALADGTGRVTGAPLFIHRTVKTSDVVFYSDQHGMAEIVLDDHVEPAGEIDGEPVEWMQVAQEHGERLRKRVAWDRANKPLYDWIKGRTVTLRR